jgi:isoquinoline 1-oxidoreductase alpha subunit
MIRLNVNGKPYDLDIDPDTPLLWALRDHAGLTGTKYGCGIAMCGACTVHVNGQPVRACVTPVAAVQGQAITTIEGVGGAKDARVAQAIQAAWNDLQVVQCGYCQTGQIMAAVALLVRNPKPSDTDIDAALSGNLCRCATYARIRAAIHQAAGALG